MKIYTELKYFSYSIAAACIILLYMIGYALSLNIHIYWIIGLLNASKIIFNI